MTTKRLALSEAGAERCGVAACATSPTVAAHAIAPIAHDHAFLFIVVLRTVRIRRMKKGQAALRCMGL
jgi:hypothetical protein